MKNRKPKNLDLFYFSDTHCPSISTPYGNSAVPYDFVGSGYELSRVEEYGNAEFGICFRGYLRVYEGWRRELDLRRRRYAKCPLKNEIDCVEGVAVFSAALSSLCCSF